MAASVSSREKMAVSGWLDRRRRMIMPSRNWLRSPRDRVRPPVPQRSFVHVLESELDAIGTPGGTTAPPTRESVLARAHDAQLLGVALSGGGIRSATFALGVLQVLSRLRLLRRVHYLSTVSGGGYIGSWLMAWICRAPGGLAEVERALCNERQEPLPIKRLRQYSNYLTPRLGWFGADTWTVIAIFLRNLILNLTVLVAMMMAFLLVPRGVAWWVWQWNSTLAVTAALAALIAITVIAWNVRGMRTVVGPAHDCSPNANPGRWYTSQSSIQIAAVLPFFFAALVATRIFRLDDAIDAFARVPALAALGTASGDPEWLRWALAGSTVAAALCILVAALRLVAHAYRAMRRRAAAATSVKTRTGETGSASVSADDQTTRRRRASRATTAAEIIAITVAAAFTGVSLRLLRLHFRGASLWETVALGPPLIVGVLLVTLVLYLGLVGRAYDDDVREWWSRLSAWALIYALVWTGVFGVAFYAAPALRWSTGAVVALGVGWIATTLAGIWAARSEATGSGGSRRWVEIVAVAAPYVFIVGLFAAVAWALDAALLRYAGVAPTPFARIGGAHPWTAAQSFAEHDHFLLYQTDAMTVWVSCALVAAVTGLFSWRMDINQFSMHLLYRNRLARCYLGASRPRRPNEFTGFDREDDLELRDLAEMYATDGRERRAPYLVINAALNLVGGEELAWQQRKAASFVFTPQFCGYDMKEGSEPPGFCPTTKFAANPVPVTLATAMAISGAAASPNMGYHSSPAATFLMTVFNVRLGWWLGNPHAARGWEHSSPGNMLLSLIRELFGLTTDVGRYVYLSDGGHFENLGIYELVRRRCRFVVACDAEEDHAFEFGGLGNAIEKCRSDFGIDIEIDVEPIRRRDEHGHSAWHCAIGKIRYDKVDGNDQVGTLIYLKASLTGDEPTDVLRYAALHHEFPHQSTGDQWFDESQFESYRALGFHAATSVFEAVDDVERLATKIADGGYTTEKLFVELRQRWYPPSAAVQASFTRHSATLADLYERLRRDADVAFLNTEIYPEWTRLVSCVSDGQPPSPRAPATLRSAAKSEQEIRSGFYLCNQMIQLMENVYIDLQLEKESCHPDNRGWMNLFHHWSWSPTFRVAWAISASTYGARFQSFCERQLALEVGPVEVALLGDGKDASAAPGSEGWTKVLEDAVARSELNPVEKAIIERLTGEGNGARADRVYLLQLAPLPTMRFTFGFTITARVAGRGPNDPRQITFFRVQDHLRQMGLARQGLEKLLKERLVDDLNMIARPDDGPEHPTVEEERYFQQLFRSVELQMAASTRSSMGGTHRI